MYEGPLTAVSMEREGAVSAMGRATIWSPSSQPCEYKPLTQHTTNTRNVRRDWFYSRPIEAAETTMWADLAQAWAIHNSTWGSRPLLTKLSLLTSVIGWEQVFSSEI